MGSGIYNFDIFQGITSSFTATLENADCSPINLSGYTLSGSFKFRFSEGGPFQPLIVSGIQPLASGVISVSIPNTENIPAGKYSYDIKGTSSGVSSLFLQGRISCYPQTSL